MSGDWSVLRNLAEKAHLHGIWYSQQDWTRTAGTTLGAFISAASPRVVKELIEENEKLRAEKPKCSCTPMPSGDGPEEDCEEHGRSYDWWVGLANKACEDRAEATTQALRWEERADKLDRSLTAALAVIKTALTELRASHYSRPFTVRSDYCRETGMFRQCESQGDPACSEACFTDTTICNGCGTQDECKYSNVIAALAAAGVDTQPPPEPLRVLEAHTLGYCTDPPTCWYEPHNRGERT